MAKQMAWTDLCDNEAPEAYWLCDEIHVYKSARVATAKFVAYKNAAARLGGKTPLPGAVKEYRISGNTFDTLFAQHAAPGGPNVMAMAYTIASSVLDTPSGQDPAVLVSFFAGAQDV